MPKPGLTSLRGRPGYAFDTVPPPSEGGGEGVGGATVVYNDTYAPRRATLTPALSQRERECGFTLIELLVTMGIIAIIAGITVVGIRAVTEGSKLASARNTVTAALDNARGLAMRDNTIVAIVFRAKLINDEKQVIEVVTAKFAGDTYSNDGNLFDRFVVIPDVAARDLPEGIKIAGPFLESDDDYLWMATSDLIAVRGDNEAAGAIIGVMYGPDGNTLRHNSRSDSRQAWVDFNSQEDLSRHGGVRQRQCGNDLHPTDPELNEPGNSCICDYGLDYFSFLCQQSPDDEPYFTPMPFLAVFDDEQCRALYDTTAWSAETAQGALNRIRDQSEYINQYADRIHFNRYTGVVMK